MSILLVVSCNISPPHNVSLPYTYLGTYMLLDAYLHIHVPRSMQGSKCDETTPFSRENPTLIYQHTQGNCKSGSDPTRPEPTSPQVSNPNRSHRKRTKYLALLSKKQILNAKCVVPTHSSHTTLYPEQGNTSEGKLTIRLVIMPWLGRDASTLDLAMPCFPRLSSISRSKH